MAMVGYKYEQRIVPVWFFGYLVKEVSKPLIGVVHAAGILAQSVVVGEKRFSRKHKGLVAAQGEEKLKERRFCLIQIGYQFLKDKLIGHTPLTPIDGSRKIALRDNLPKTGRV